MRYWKYDRSFINKDLYGFLRMPLLRRELIR